MVSSGAQKNFVEFAKQIETAWKAIKISSAMTTSAVSWQVNPLQSVRQRVMKSDWYTSGYLANIVTYTLAKLSLESKRASGGGDLDFARIWLAQAVDHRLLEMTDVIPSRSSEF